MCPACIETMAFVVAGASSTGGLTALVASKLRRQVRSEQNPQTAESKENHDDRKSS